MKPGLDDPVCQTGKHQNAVCIAGYFSVNDQAVNTFAEIFGFNDFEIVHSGLSFFVIGRFYHPAFEIDMPNFVSFMKHFSSK